MKILHILRSPRAEGTVKLTLDWLLEPGLEQEVFVIDPLPAEMTGMLRASAGWYGEGRRLPAGPGKYPWMLGKIRQVCKARRPDLVICWTNGFSPWILGGAWLAGVPGLITHAGNPPNWTLWGRIQTYVSMKAARLTGGTMVCCSHYVAEQFARSLGAVSSVLRVVHNCAPVVQIQQAATEARMRRVDQRPCLIMVATLESHKDHATLLRAMPEVIRAVPAVRLRLVGDGTLRAELQNLSASLVLTESVEFLGSRRDVPSLLGQSDVFVFSTTKEEGLGTVLIEALAAGLPIVASDVPACREALDDGRWGTLVPAADPGALAKVLIASLLVSAPVATGSRYDYLQQFTPPRMIAAYVGVVS